MTESLEAHKIAADERLFFGVTPALELHLAAACGGKVRMSFGPENGCRRDAAGELAAIAGKMMIQAHGWIMVCDANVISMIGKKCDIDVDSHKGFASAFSSVT